ncbi:MULTISPECIES: membrane protein [Streptomyces]|uniref:membrane protein n=1 Tax=Streptomyces TaxID=1883 RepID=UPI000463558B|nr:membrane protein [Streptomyces exfoliatus]
MNATSGSSPSGALLLCRADPSAVRPPAQLLREQLLLAPAGDDWSVLVPEGKPWLHGGEPVEQVVTGWATALAVSTATWPVLALWWDRDRAGFTLAAGFRRTVGYTWLADGTPVGEDEAMRTFAARLALDPVLDVQALEPLTRPDPEADAHSRLVGIVAVLARAGLALPTGLVPGDSADRLRSVALAQGAEQLEWPGWRDVVRAELDVVEEGPLGPYLRGPKARVLGGAQLAAGVPLLVWGIGRRSGGWATAGALLVVHGALGLVYDRLRDR